jgi:3-hydroxyacyl-CoA dehydrogenase
MSNVIKKVAVVGTGTLGTQIAMQAANANYQVKVFDVNFLPRENSACGKY